MKYRCLLAYNQVMGDMVLYLISTYIWSPLIIVWYSCTYRSYVRCAMFIVRVWRMPWPRKGATQYHAHLGLPAKCRAIKGLDVSYDRDLEPLDLLNGMALGCYQLSHRYKNEKRLVFDIHIRYKTYPTLRVL